MPEKNPYAPPDAKLADPAPAPGSPVKAVTLGLAVDIGGTVVATVLLGLAYGIVLGASGASAEEIEAITTRASTDSWFFYATAWWASGSPRSAATSAPALPGARSSSSARSLL